MDDKVAAHLGSWEVGKEDEIERMYNNQQTFMQNPNSETSKAFIADMFHYMKHMNTNISHEAQSELEVY